MFGWEEEELLYNAPRAVPSIEPAEPAATIAAHHVEAATVDECDLATAPAGPMPHAVYDRPAEKEAQRAREAAQAEAAALEAGFDEDEDEEF